MRYDTSAGKAYLALLKSYMSLDPVRHVLVDDIPLYLTMQSSITVGGSIFPSIASSSSSAADNRPVVLGLPWWPLVVIFFIKLKCNRLSCPESYSS